MGKNKKNGKDIPVEFLDENPTTDNLDKTEEKPDLENENLATEKDIEDLRKKYEESQKKYTDLNEQLLRFRAEFANYKRRTEKEQAEFSNYVKGELIKKILPVLDDFKHMLDKSEAGNSEQSVLEGARMIYNKFYQILESEGLEKLSAEGEEFDPQIHEAMMMQNTDNQEMHNKILAIFQEGYKLNDRILRPGKVIVGNYQEDGEQSRN